MINNPGRVLKMVFPYHDLTFMLKSTRYIIHLQMVIFYKNVYKVNHQWLEFLMPGSRYFLRRYLFLQMYT